MELQSKIICYTHEDMSYGPNPEGKETTSVQSIQKDEFSRGSSSHKAHLVAGALREESFGTRHVEIVMSNVDIDVILDVLKGCKIVPSIEEAVAICIRFTDLTSSRETVSLLEYVLSHRGVTWSALVRGLQALNGKSGGALREIIMKHKMWNNPSLFVSEDHPICYDLLCTSTYGKTLMKTMGQFNYSLADQIVETHGISVALHDCLVCRRYILAYHLMKKHHSIVSNQHSLLREVKLHTEFYRKWEQSL